MGVRPSARKPPGSEPTSPQAHAVRLNYSTSHVLSVCDLLT